LLVALLLAMFCYHCIEEPWRRKLTAIFRGSLRPTFDMTKAERRM
jgi:peptidoglycan/LPS O-acetylase OafA/YrhL